MTDMDIQKAKELNDMLRSGTKLNFYDEKTIPQNVQADRWQSISSRQSRA